MPVTVVVGGQYGSEGKGKVAAYLVKRNSVDTCVRCGGPNSGHCVVDNCGNKVVLRQLPTAAAVRKETRLLIPAGGVINLDVLAHEIRMLGITPARLGVDFRAMVITPEDRAAEEGMWNTISSTRCGVGAAVARKVMRGSDVKLASESCTWLEPYIVNATDEVNRAIDHKAQVLVEGSQGFGLSLYHSLYYPKATSRDTTAAGCISECGISPLSVTDVVLVARTFPIRVAGAQAGPLRWETTWGQVTKDCDSPEPILEYTTVTRRERRVGHFEWGQFQSAVKVNRPSAVALNFVDYLWYNDRFAKGFESLSSKTKDFVLMMDSQFGVPVKYLGTGPETILENPSYS